MEIVKTLLDSADVVALQELMLCKRDIHLLNDINKDFDNIATVKDREMEGINEGRPSQGVAIFWRKKISHCVKQVIINDSLIGIVISGKSSRVLLINVYMPCDLQTLNALDNYRHMVALLEVVIAEQNINNVIVMGDFNADSRKGRFWNELSHFRQSLF